MISHRMRANKPYWTRYENGHKIGRAKRFKVEARFCVLGKVGDAQTIDEQLDSLVRFFFGAVEGNHMVVP